LNKYKYIITKYEYKYYIGMVKHHNIQECYLRNLTEVVANSRLVVGVATMAVKGLDAMFQPPTANSVFNVGLRIFMSLKRSYLQIDSTKG